MSRLTGPVARFDVPIRPNGRQRKPVDRPFQTRWTVPVTGAIGKSETRVPGARSRSQRPGRGEHGVFGTKDDCRRSDAARQNRPDRHRMIDPAGGETGGEDERRVDPGQTLLEVGRVLLGHVGDPDHARACRVPSVAGSSESKSPITATG